MVLKEGVNATLQVAPGLYFPKEMGTAALAYQVINKKTGVVEFEEVQLGAAWEAFQHFDTIIGDIYDELEGKKAPVLAVVGADALPDDLIKH